MIELQLDLRHMTLEDTQDWPDMPFVADLLLATCDYIGRRVTVRLVDFHEAPGPTWGHCTGK